MPTGDVSPRLGQVWAWDFRLGDGSWPFQVVTDKARQNFADVSLVFVSRGATFIVLALDDPGPAEVPHFDLVGDLARSMGDSLGLRTNEKKRWHVVLFPSRGMLAWMSDDMFEQARYLWGEPEADM